MTQPLTFEAVIIAIERFAALGRGKVRTKTRLSHAKGRWHLRVETSSERALYIAYDKDLSTLLTRAYNRLKARAREAVV